MKTCWLAIGVSLRCLLAMPANALKFPATGDPRQILWPSHDQEEHLKHGAIEWQKGVKEKYGALRGPVCYQGTCGLGHRDSRTVGQALQAWAHGQPLSIAWPECNGVNSWSLVHDEQVMIDKYSDWISVGAQGENCQINVSNEPYFDTPDLEKEFRHAESGGFVHPATKWYYALQQIGFKSSRLGSVAGRFLQQEFQGHGASVIGVHLRLGNGEEALTNDDRTPTIPRRDIFKYVSQTADKIAEEVLKVSAKNVRIFVASDTHSALEEFHRFDPRVFFFTGGKWVQDNQGVNIGLGNDEACADMEHRDMVDTVLLGHADVLMTPMFSTFTQRSRIIALNRGAQWCQNQQWKWKTGTILDPATVDIEVEAARSHYEDDDENVASTMHEWEAILNGSNDIGYKCYYYENQGLQSRAVTL
jgi:hypothetical protein